MRLFVLCCITSLLASADWVIDPTTSQVRFSGTSTLHDFIGSATLLPCTPLHLDATAASGTIEADATSMTTSDGGRDERMHNFVMESGTFPRVRFDLTGWAPTPGGGTATGTWSMHGVTLPVTLPVRIAGGRAKAHLDLNIRDWKIRTPRIVFITVGDIVGVDLDLALTARP